MIKYLILLFFPFLIILSGCSSETENDLNEISVIPEIHKSDSGIVYSLDTLTSLITWAGKNQNDKHNGIFRIKEGIITIVKEEAISAKQKDLKTITGGEIIIDMTSLDILNLKHTPEKYSKIRKYLHSKDFFHTEKYPVAHFKLHSLKPIETDSVRQANSAPPDVNPTHTAEGELTIKGITKKIEFPVKIDMRNLKVEVSGKINLGQSAWKLNYMNETTDPEARSSDDQISNILSVGFEILAFSYQP